MSAEEAVRGATLEASVVALFPWIAYMLGGARTGGHRQHPLLRGGDGPLHATKPLRGRARAHPRRVRAHGATERDVRVHLHRCQRVFGAAEVLRHRGVDRRHVPRQSRRRRLSGRQAHQRTRRGRGFEPHPRRRGNVRVRRVRGWRGRAAAAIFGGGAPIPDAHAHMLWFSGLRGAMAFALALEAAARRGDDGHAMLTGTLGAVLFTVLVVGGFVVPALEHLGIRATRGGANGANGANGGGTFRDAGGSSSDARSEDEVAVLIRSEKSDGAASKRSRGVVVGGGAGGDTRRETRRRMRTSTAVPFAIRSGVSTSGFSPRISPWTRGKPRRERRDRAAAATAGRVDGGRWLRVVAWRRKSRRVETKESSRGDERVVVRRKIDSSLPVHGLPFRSSSPPHAARPRGPPSVDPGWRFPRLRNPPGAPAPAPASRNPAHRRHHVPTGEYSDPPASATSSPTRDCGVYADSKTRDDARMVRNLLAVDMTSNAVADKKSRLLFDADASATP